MTDKELLEGLKQIVTNHLQMLNEAKKEIKNKQSELNSKIFLLKKFLNIIKEPKDLYKKETKKFYEKNIKAMLMNSKDIFMRDILDNEVEAEKLNMICNSEEEMAKQIIIYANLALEEFNSELESYGDITEYSNEIKRIKLIFKSITSNIYFENDETTNLVIDYIEQSDFNNNTKNDLINLIKNTRLNYIKKLEMEKIKRENNTKSINIKQKTDEKPIISNNKFKYEDFFNNDDLELIKEMNQLLFNEKKSLNSISKNHIDFYLECFNYTNKEIINLGFMKNETEIKNARNIIILFNIKNKLEEIDKIVNFLKNNDYNDEQFENYLKIKDEKLLEIQNLYLEYEKEDLNNVITNEKDKSKNNIVYLTNENGNTIFESYLDKKEEYYSLFIKMLKDLENGITTKDKTYTDIGNNLHRKRNYNSRLVYLPYGDVNIVFFEFIKKSKKDTYNSDMIRNIYYSNKENLDNLINDLNDEEKRKQILEENYIIHEQILNKLKNSARGKKLS